MLQVIILISNRVKDLRVESENEKNYLSRNKYKDIVWSRLIYLVACNLISR